jgi:hypothetical protein
MKMIIYIYIKDDTYLKSLLIIFHCHDLGFKSILWALIVKKCIVIH